MPNPKKISSMLVYSPDQVSAITDFSSTMAVSAGAGSGKTAVLVERFLHAITVKKTSADRMLAITFTEKAAQEMKSRLVRFCEERGLDAQRRKLENSYISTIDGFCARILKENPIEAGADPFFQILGEGEAEILMMRVMDVLFEKESENSSFLKLIVDFGEKELRQLLRFFYTAVNSRSEGTALLESKSFEDQTKQVREKLLNICGQIKSSVSDTNPNKTESALLSAAADIPMHLATKKKDIPEVLRCLDASMEGVERRGQWKDLADDLIATVRTWKNLLALQLAEPQKNEFRRLFEIFWTSYESEKNNLAAYDFTDLVKNAYRLLSADSAQGRALKKYYQDYFSYILVDEYQDTSALQAGLVRLLERDHNLFVVGDAKQSIYGFRQATPEPFVALEGFSHITLSENYRSRPEILSFINSIAVAIFPTAMQEPLKPERKFALKKTHCVELLCVTRDESEDMDRSRVVEARTLARRLKELVDSRMLVEGRDGKSRALCYGDIAVLFRSTTSSYLYEKELEEQSLPFFVVKGSGFYDKPEIKDLIHFLKFLENPSLDISLAGVLRSPLCGISENALYWLSRYAKSVDSKTPLYPALDVLENIPRLSTEDREKLISFTSFSKKIQSVKNHRLISEILEELLSETAYEAKILALPDGTQKCANVRKLVDTARAMEASRLFSIDDFVRYLEGLAERDIVESEAKIQSEVSDSVVLSSIHAAKGLEYPMIVIADLGKADTRSFERRLLCDEAWGLGGQWKNSQTSEWLEDFAFVQIHKKNSERETAEADRLLYVAMTRAQEHLILSGSIGVESKTGFFKQDKSWMNLFLRQFQLSQLVPGRFEWRGVKILAIPESSAEDVQFKKSNPSVDSDFFRKKIASGQVFSKEEAEKIGWGFDEAAAQTILSKLDIQWKPYTSARDASVTELLKEESGAEEPDRPILSGYGDEENIPRNEFGTLFHRLMEISLHRYRQGKAIGTSFFEPLLRGLAASEKQEMLGSVLKFWKCPTGRLVRRAQKCYPELPFIYKTPHGLLKGQLDLVFQSVEGEWIILDYKTNQISESQKEKTAAEYEFQLGLYALVFSELYGEIPHRGILYFSSLDQTREFNYSAGYLEEIKKRLLDVQRAVV